MIRAYRGIVPKIAASSYIDPSAQVIGDVEVGVIFGSGAGGQSLMLAELARRPSVERIDLGPLDLAETSAQLAAVLGVEPDPALVRRIHRRSDGNPFFIEQLAWAHADGESSSVPASLRDILLTQLSRQTREVQDLLAAVAIAGPGADDALLASIVGCSTDALLDPLRSAVRAQLLTRIPTEAGEAYAFRHGTDIIIRGVKPTQTTVLAWPGGP